MYTPPYIRRKKGKIYHLKSKKMHKKCIFFISDTDTGAKKYDRYRRVRRCRNQIPTKLTKQTPTPSRHNKRKQQRQDIIREIDALERCAIIENIDVLECCAILEYIKILDERMLYHNTSLPDPICLAGLSYRAFYCMPERLQFCALRVIHPSVGHEDIHYAVTHHLAGPCRGHTLCLLNGGTFAYGLEGAGAGVKRVAAAVLGGQCVVVGCACFQTRNGERESCFLYVVGRIVATGALKVMDVSCPLALKTSVQMILPFLLRITSS